ncbi:MAG: hypothetical protein K2F97_01750 [Muribaculaceae bacterium]|nr:hypothetical protein [Muribaculaceae bacterium]
MRLTGLILALGVAIAASGADYTLTERRAERNFAYGEWAQAEALYELMLDERPDTAPVYARAIVASTMMGDTLRCADLLERAMAHSVPLDSVVEGVRRAAFGAGRADAYVDFLQRTRLRMPWMARALDARLLDYYDKRSDGPEIVRLAGEMLRGLPDSTRYLSLLARGHMLQGHGPEAEAAWCRILTLEPDNVDALRSLGLRLLATGRDAEGRPLLERAQALSPTPYIENMLQ